MPDDPKPAGEDVRVAAERAACLDAATDPGGDYHFGLGCGLEDRGITDRYEAAIYGWQQAFEYVQSAIGLAPMPALEAMQNAARLEGLKTGVAIADAEREKWRVAGIPEGALGAASVRDAISVAAKAGIWPPAAAAPGPS